jgi:TolB-like protein
MKVKQINIEDKSVVIEYLNKERLVTFNDNGDIDIEPFNDLSEEEGQELFDRIITSDVINAALPFED